MFKLELNHMGHCAAAATLRALLAAALLALALPAAAFHFPWDQGHDTTNSNDPPPAGPCEGPNCDDDCNSNSSRSPVYAALGHSLWRDSDVVLRGRPYVGIYRVYNSNDPVVGLFGNGWSVCFDVALYPANNSGVQQRIYKAPNGKRFVFVKQSDGTFKSPDGRFETVTEGTSTVTMSMLDGRRNIFALDGRLLERVDVNGNRVTFNYDSAIRPTRMADSNGRFLQIAYNAAGLVDTVADHAGRTWRYGYDTTGNLVSVTDPAGGVQRYTWLPYRALNDAFTYYQLLSVTDPSGVVAVSFTYTGNRVSSYTEGANRITYTRQATNTSLAGTVTQRDALNVSTIFDYGALGLVTRDRDGVGGVTTYTYDSNGRITNTVDALGRSWLDAYDALGRIISSSNPLGQTSTNLYGGSDPRPLRMTSPSGRVVSMTYDSRGNLLTATDPSGAVSSMSYTAQGEVAAITNGLNQTQTFSYNAIGQPVGVVDALGRQSSMIYDTLGRVTSMTNAAGETTRYAYDVLDRATAITDPLNRNTAFGYDATGRLLNVTDAKGSVTQYQYDSNGRLSAEVAPDGRRTGYGYRLDNLLSTITFPDNTAITYTYDSNKRVVNEVAGGETINYSYNAINQLISVTGPGGTVTYTYDAAGRMVTETSRGRTNTIVRNAEGESVQLNTLGQNQTFTRNSRGLITRIAANVGNFDFGFDALGRRNQMAYPNGSTASYAYDAAGQLSGLTHAGALNAPYAYAFDAAGRITRKTGDGPDWNYTYDAAGRLTNASQGATNFNYALDPVGNDIGSGSSYDANHRLIADAARDYSYDMRGNLVLERERSTGARVVYGWNVKNQLLRIDFFADAVATTPARTLLYSYDPLGRRATKSDGGVLQQFVYDGGDLVGALDAFNNVTSAQVFSGAVDEPIASTKGGVASFLYGDHQGSVTAVAAGAALTHTYSYGPYGQPLAGSSPDSTAFRYTGREKDTDTLYYYRARYYSTGQQRFISNDPIGMRGGINPYQYVEGNPVSYTDPTGEFIPQLIGFGIGAGLEYLTNPCASASDILLAGGLGALGGGLSKAAFLRLGPRSLTRETGLEWSHSIARSTVNRNTSGGLNSALNQRGGLNGSWRTPASHARHDASRHVPGVDPMPLPLRALDRIPDWLKGTGLGGGVGAAVAGRDCDCRR